MRGPLLACSLLLLAGVASAQDSARDLPLPAKQPAATEEASPREPTGATGATAAGDAPLSPSGYVADPCGCRWPLWKQLTPAQRALVGPEEWRAMTRDQRAVLLNLTYAAAHAGLDLTGLQLKEIEDDRLILTPDSVEHLKASMQRAIAAGTFEDVKPCARFHPGLCDLGARQDTRRYSLQLGFGTAGGFMDIDTFNPKHGIWGFLGHVGEVTLHKVLRGKTNPFRVGKHLGWDVVGYRVCSKHRHGKARHQPVEQPPQASAPAQEGAAQQVAASAGQGRP